jgi:aminopeptidase-like protein
MDARAAQAAAHAVTGQALYAFAARLYPICRSLTGDGVRQTLALIRARIPLQLHEVRSGTRIYDWEVPPEWNIEDACVMDRHGRRVVDFQAHNLHLVSYSEPLSRTLSLAELAPHLHTLPAQPDWIPYRTSYYQRSWGFCLSERARAQLEEDQYRVEIRSSLAPGALSYGELAIPGRSREEVLFFTHICHPSLANDNTSGMAVATHLAEWIAREPRRLSYRFVFAPGTLGSLTWLKRNAARLRHIRHGLVLTLLGDRAGLTYKRSRHEDREIDAIGAHIAAAGTVLPFSPYGYDERQFCSPGFDLPVGRLTRSVNGGYPEYHTSADNLDLICPESLAGSLQACTEAVEIMEGNARYRNLNPKGEPRLGKHGLYRPVGGESPVLREHALLWVLNQSDGTHTLLDIAQRSGLPFAALRAAARELEGAQLLRNVSPRGSAASVTPRTARPRRRGGTIHRRKS